MDINATIKARYKTLPTNIQQAITSTDLATKFEAIAKKHELHVDQNGSLQTETLLVMLGLETVDDYMGNIQRELEIPKEKAFEIAKDVNAQILDAIRDSLREIQKKQEEAEIKENEVKETSIDHSKTISSIEKAGDFTIEQNPASSSPQYSEQNIDKDAVLKGIEDDHIPMVDHLLENHVNSPVEVEVKKVEETKTYTVDPYREQA